MNTLQIHTQLQLRATNNQQFRGRIISAGNIRTITNEASPINISPNAIHDAIKRRLFEGLACFIDHTQNHPSIRNLFGTWSSIAWNQETQSADGTLIILETAETKSVADRLTQILALQSDGRATPDIGVSLVFYPEWDETNPRTVARFQHIESADIVFFPAADGRILQALSALNQHMEDNMAENNQTAEETTAANFIQAIDEQAQLQLSTSNKWVNEIATAAVTAILANTDLPLPVKKRLAAQRYETPADVHKAIKAARIELQELDAEEVIQLSDRPWIYVKDPHTDIQRHVDWFFGVPDTPAPPANYRRIDDLYIALTGDQQFHGVFNRDRVMLAAADTSTLANMAVDAMNKVVQIQMSRLDFWRWYERIAQPIPNDGSVQSMKLITYGGIGNLPTVAEGAAYTELTVDDVKETATFTKKGGYVGITMEMIRNSQIVQIQAVPRALATAAVRTRSAAVSALFTSNSGVGPTLAQDSTALFHANHGNVATTALGTDLTAWSAARAECFEHAEVNSSKSLAVFPRYLLVPAELYDVALSIFGYGEGMPTSYNIAAQDRGPIDPRPIPLVVPDWTDATDWAYIVDPDIFPVIQISYAQAPGGGTHPAPELYSVSNEEQGLIFTNDVMPIKVRDWFAVNVNGPRGIGKRNVAG